ncbi:MAG: hypothetical protein ACFB9M_12500 [Myxococcota bacterium]
MAPVLDVFFASLIEPSWAKRIVRHGTRGYQPQRLAVSILVGLSLALTQGCGEDEEPQGEPCETVSDCGEDDNECTGQACVDGFCVTSLALAGTACGSATEGVCDLPDTCDGFGVCETNNLPSSTECRAAAGECDVAEFCNGVGGCPIDSLADAGTVCGDDTDTICNPADTCNGDGTCVVNIAPQTTECRPSQGECDAAEFCDGNGTCASDVIAEVGTACGDPSSGVCDQPDTCDETGACAANNLPSTTECRAMQGECDAPEFCSSGVCPADSVAAAGTACGDPAASDCDAPDSCDGNGVCQPNLRSVQTVCRASQGACDAAEFCDGAGSCPADAVAAAGTPCGDNSDTVCDAPDTCNAAGVCQPNNEPAGTECRASTGDCDVAEVCDNAGNCPADSLAAAGTPCGDNTDEVCNRPDTCDGSGTCQANLESSGTECRAADGPCDEAEFCDNGSCPVDVFAAQGTACGSPVNNACTDPDTCDGQGSCASNDEPITTECRSAVDDCDAAEFCDGSGTCPPNDFAMVGTVCGDQSDTECNGADTCDGSGNCDDNFTPPTVTCRDAQNECDVAEQCDGQGSCPADILAVSGTPCGDGTNGVCTDPDTCDGQGGCQPNDASTAQECRGTQGNECDVAEFCDGNGACPPNDFAMEGAPCGDGSSTVCDEADSCDGAGSCQPNFVSTNVECRGTGGDECDVAEFCDGQGNCPGDDRATAGSPCGDRSRDECDEPDTCDDNGNCQPNFVSPNVECRSSFGTCDFPEFCDGQGNCPSDSVAPPGSDCEIEGGVSCNLVGICDESGMCNFDQRDLEVLDPGSRYSTFSRGDCEGIANCPLEFLDGTGSGDLRLRWTPPDGETVLITLSQVEPIDFDPFMVIEADGGFADDDIPCQDDNAQGSLPLLRFTPTCGQQGCETIQIVIDSQAGMEGEFNIDVRPAVSRIF